MGFGSFDEGEQEQSRNNDEAGGEGVTGEIKGDNADADGEASTDDETVEEMMEYL